MFFASALKKLLKKTIVYYLGTSLAFVGTMWAIQWGLAHNQPCGPQRIDLISKMSLPGNPLALIQDPKVKPYLANFLRKN